MWSGLGFGNFYNQLAVSFHESEITHQIIIDRVIEYCQKEVVPDGWADQDLGADPDLSNGK